MLYLIKMRKLVVFTGAGISAESGIKTFRDSDGLWEEYNIMDVATPEAWTKSPELVLEFYNKRKAQVKGAMPNLAHNLVAELEDNFKVRVITQNIDDLHERAGSTRVLHLHGEILKSRSSRDPNLLYKTNGEDIEMGALCELGSQLRPHVVWFGEDVPAMAEAAQIVKQADYFLVVGTSLVVYPAASLVSFVPADAQVMVIDPKAPAIDHAQVSCRKETASIGVPAWARELLSQSQR